MNYSSDKRNVNSSWRCDSCMRAGTLSMDSQPHILVCPAYKELRADKSLSSIEDLTEYYAQVMKIRDNLSKLVNVPFVFENTGSRIALYQPEGL